MADVVRVVLDFQQQAERFQIGDDGFAASSEFSELKAAHMTLLAAPADDGEREAALVKCRKLCPSSIAGYYRRDLSQLVQR